MSGTASFTPAEWTKVAEVLARWANNHPDPDEPVWAVYGIVLSPNLMAQAATDPESKAAQALYRMFSRIIGSDEIGTLDDLLKTFEIDDREPPPSQPPAPRP